MLVMSPVLGRDSPIFGAEDIIAVTKISCAIVLLKSVQILNCAPHIEPAFVWLSSFDKLIETGKFNPFCALSHSTSGRDDIIAPVPCSSFKAGRIEVALGTEATIHSPTYFAGWQIAGIDKAHVTGQASVTRRKRFNTFGLYGEVGALKNAGIFFLPFGRAPSFVLEIVGRYPQQHGRDGKNDRKSSNELFLVGMEEVKEFSEAETGDGGGGAAKKGAVISFTAITGCGLAWWLARRRP